MIIIGKIKEVPNHIYHYFKKINHSAANKLKNKQKLGNKIEDVYRKNPKGFLFEELYSLLIQLRLNFIDCEKNGKIPPLVKLI